MNNRAKIMIVSAIFLLALLIAKSLWFDPVKDLEGDALKYQKYALEVAPHQDTFFNINLPIVEYKVVSVKKIKDEGETKITYRDENGRLREEEIEGDYTAKVRAYLFSILPFTDLQIKGGQM